VELPLEILHLHLGKLVLVSMPKAVPAHHGSSRARSVVWPTDCLDAGDGMMWALVLALSAALA
jgi:hypothetical protein